MPARYSSVSPHAFYSQTPDTNASMSRVHQEDFDDEDDDQSCYPSLFEDLNVLQELTQPEYEA